MRNRIIIYLKFLLNSKNEYGIHSPFVFNLVTKCLYKKNISHGFQIWENYRKELFLNKNYIEVEDFGAGSKVFKSNRRQVSRIAKYTGISKKRAKLLIRLSHYLKFHSILEIGTSLGLCSAAISIGNSEANIKTLEGCGNTAQIANNMFLSHQLNNIRVMTGDFQETLDKSLQNTLYDLIYFDGNHSKDATIQYFEKCLPYAHNDTLFLFDDIHWSQEMEDAWNYIINHKKVKVSIDTFQWGLVFFRREQQKEHFIIRI